MNSFYSNELIQFKKNDNSKDLNNYAIKNIKKNDSDLNYKYVNIHDKTNNNLDNYALQTQKYLRNNGGNLNN